MLFNSANDGLCFPLLCSWSVKVTILGRFLMSNYQVLFLIAAGLSSLLPEISPCSSKPLAIAQEQNDEEMDPLLSNSPS